MKKIFSFFGGKKEEKKALEALEAGEEGAGVECLGGSFSGSEEEDDDDEEEEEVVEETKETEMESGHDDDDDGSCYLSYEAGSGFDTKEVYLPKEVNRGINEKKDGTGNEICSLKLSDSIEDEFSDDVEGIKEEDIDVISEIGRGSCSVVSKAVWKKSGGRQLVCLKEFHLQNYVKIQNFQNELKIMARLNHPSIVRVFGWYQNSLKENYITLVMELLAMNLWVYCLRNHSRLSYYDIFRIMEKMQRSLKFLAENGIVHRDIRADNFVVSKNAEVVKLTDFGISKIKQQQSQTSVLTDYKGNPSWQPHECHGEGKLRYSTQSDIYSLGMAFYQIIFNRIPYKGMTEEKNLILEELKKTHKVLHKVPRSGAMAFFVIPEMVKRGRCPDTRSKRVPKAFVTLLSSMWKKNPKERISIEDLGKWFKDNEELFKKKYSGKCVTKYTRVILPNSRISFRSSSTDIDDLLKKRKIFYRKVSKLGDQKLQIFLENVKIRSNFFSECFVMNGKPEFSFRELVDSSQNSSMLKNMLSSLRSQLKLKNEMIKKTCFEKENVALTSMLEKVFEMFNHSSLSTPSQKEMFCDLLLILQICSVKESQEVVVQSVWGETHKTFLVDFVRLRRKLFEKTVKNLNKNIRKKLSVSFDQLLDPAEFDYSAVLWKTQELLQLLNKNGGSFESFILCCSFYIHIFSVTKLTEKKKLKALKIIRGLTGFDNFSMSTSGIAKVIDISKQGIDVVTSLETFMRDWLLCFLAEMGKYVFSRFSGTFWGIMMKIIGKGEDCSAEYLEYVDFINIGIGTIKKWKKQIRSSMENGCGESPTIKKENPKTENALLSTRRGKRPQASKKKLVKKRKKKKRREENNNLVLSESVDLLSDSSEEDESSDSDNDSDDSSDSDDSDDECFFGSVSISSDEDEDFDDSSGSDEDSDSEKEDKKNPEGTLSNQSNAPLMKLLENMGFSRLRSVLQKRGYCYDDFKHTVSEMDLPRFIPVLQRRRFVDELQKRNIIKKPVEKEIAISKKPKLPSSGDSQGKGKPILKWCKLAFLAGISKYSTLSPLKAPLKDVEEMAKLLSEEKFEIVQYDQNKRATLKEQFLVDFIQLLAKKIANCEKGTRFFVLFLFSGHGLGDKNEELYLLDPKFDESLKDSMKQGEGRTNMWTDCLTEKRVLLELQSSKNPHGHRIEPVVIFDCCRNDVKQFPFDINTRSEKKCVTYFSGLIVHAVGKGQIAKGQHGKEECSLYTEKLLSNLRKMNDSFFLDILDKTGDDVVKASKYSADPDIYVRGIARAFKWKCKKRDLGVWKFPKIVPERKTHDGQIQSLVAETTKIAKNLASTVNGIQQLTVENRRMTDAILQICTSKKGSFPVEIQRSEKKRILLEEENVRENKQSIIIVSKSETKISKNELQEPNEEIKRKNGKKEEEERREDTAEEEVFSEMSVFFRRMVKLKRNCEPTFEETESDEVLFSPDDVDSPFFKEDETNSEKFSCSWSDYSLDDDDWNDSNKISKRKNKEND